MSDLYSWFQDPAVDHCVAHLLNGTGSKLYAGPTGCGKGVVQARIMNRIDDLVHLVPNIEIACNQYAKMTGDKGIYDWSEPKQREATESSRVFTFTRFYNQLAKGEIDPPKRLLYDEAHHSVADRESVSYEYTGNVPRAGFTATPYRGTPQESAKLLKAWGNEIIQIITLKDAVARGVIAHPKWTIWPLINDDLIGIANGEFKIGDVEKVVGSAIEGVVTRIAAEHWVDGLMKRPAAAYLTTEKLCMQFHDMCKHHGIHSEVITAKTGSDRQRIFRDTVDRKCLLINIRVVGEGIDLPLRTLFDMAPTMSPVLWQQRLGRITRPTDEQPEYIACCQNLSRHAYLWSGVLPASAVRESQQAFGGVPSKRDVIRGFGDLVGFGKFTSAPVPFSSGIAGSFYSLMSPNGFTKLGVLLHPLSAQAMYGKRDDSSGKRGDWVPILELPEVRGWVSTHNSPLTPPMRTYYENAAGYYKLDPKAEINSRSFQAFPFIKDLYRYKGPRRWFDEVERLSNDG